MRSIQTYATLLILIIACMMSPALADVKYTGGSPNLSAYVSGLNEFTAGSDITIPVVLVNSGLNQYEEVSSNITARDDLPNTAKFVTVQMSAADAPLVIKSDPQMIGDIRGQTTATAVFSATVNADAPAGTYLLPVDINYSTLSSVDEYTAQPMFQNYYQQHTMTLTVPLVIKAEVIPQVISATPYNLVAGADGYVNITLKNVGSLDGTKATVRLLQDGQSPIAPVDNGVYIGDFPIGSIVTCPFKVSVDAAAVNKSYPVNIIVTYQNNEGDFVNSRTETTGVSVGNKVNFVIISPTIKMSPGSKNTIQVEYKNTGDSTIENAQALISMVTPFSSTSAVADLGNIAPGQSAIASYQISVSGNAVTKLYGLDSEIRYHDALDDTYVSDPVKVSIDVENLTGIEGILSNTVILSIIVAALIGLIYAIWYFRKKQR
jgi:hypothetical protein